MQMYTCICTHALCVSCGWVREAIRLEDGIGAEAAGDACLVACAAGDEVEGVVEAEPVHIGSLYRTVSKYVCMHAEGESRSTLAACTAQLVYASATAHWTRAHAHGGVGCMHRVRRWMPARDALSSK